MIYVISDTSGSMSCLAKPVIVKNVCNTLEAIKETDDRFSDVEWTYCDWAGSASALQQLFEAQHIERAFILSDGYYEEAADDFILRCNTGGKKVTVVYCGGDARVNKKIGIKAQDIYFALEDMAGFYER